MYNPDDEAQALQLLTEIQSGPYDAALAANNDQAVADALNQPVSPAQTVPRGKVDSADVIAAIDLAAWEALTAARRDYLLALLSHPQVDSASPQIRNAFGAMFTDATLARLTAVGDEPNASRAELLFGVGTVITHTDVRDVLS